MEIVYRSGKFVFSGECQELPKEELDDFIQTNRTLAGDFGAGRTISRTPETESNVLKLAQRLGKTIRLEGIHNQCKILDGANGFKKGQSKNNLIAVLVNWQFPLQSINQKVYDKLVELSADRVTASEETYDLIFEKFNGNAVVSSIRMKGITVEKFRKNMRLK